MRTIDRKPRFITVANPSLSGDDRIARLLSSADDAIVYTQGPIIDMKPQRTWSQGNGRIRRALSYIVGAAVLFALIMGFMLLAVDAIDRESAWREERLCRIYGVCDPHAGP